MIKWKAVRNNEILVTGDAQVTIAVNYKMGPAVVGRIIYDHILLLDMLCMLFAWYLDARNSEADWKCIGHDFETKWNFPNALRTKDGKHVLIKAHAGSGSSFFNYKK